MSNHNLSPQWYPVETKKKAVGLPLEMWEPKQTAYPITERALHNLRAEFIAKRDHILTEAHWDGIRDICAFMEDQARGKAGKENACSTLPPGVGKSSAVIEMTRQFVSEPSCSDVGVIILVHQLDQITRFVEEIFGPEGLCEAPQLSGPESYERDKYCRSKPFAILTGAENKALNAMGRGCYKMHKDGSVTFESDHQSAQVLFVTQAKLLSLVAYSDYHKDFAGYYAPTKLTDDEVALLKANPDLKPEDIKPPKHVHFWFYKDTPRQVRVWDESIEASKPLVIRLRDMYKAAARVAEYSPALFKKITAIADDVAAKAVEGAATYTFPDLFEINLGKVDKDAWPKDDGVDDPLNVIFRMCGKTVRVKSDPKREAADNTILYYRELLPKNFEPCLVLDASGGYRVCYEVWPQEKGGGMLALRSAAKTYKNLTIRHWDYGAGKFAMRIEDRREEMAQAVAQAVLSLPPSERVLVVHRKPEKNYKVQVPDVVRASVKALGGDPSVIEFLTWGRHTATNAFQGIKHVIACGVLQYSPDHNEAHFRSAAMLPPGAEVMAKDLERTRVGEIAHHLLQAVGRGGIRRMKDGDCPEGCTLHAIFSAKDVNPNALFGWTFPGAKVEPWYANGALSGTALHSRTRVDFVEMLLRRVVTAPVFERRDLEGAFHPSRIQVYLNDKAVRAALAEKAVTLDRRTEWRKREGKRGATPVEVYTLRRLEPGQPEPELRASICL